MEFKPEAVQTEDFVHLNGVMEKRRICGKWAVPGQAGYRAAAGHPPVLPGRQVLQQKLPKLPGWNGTR